jgi:hypothetical protein
MCSALGREVGAPDSGYPVGARATTRRTGRPPGDEDRRHTLGATDRSRPHPIPPIRIRAQTPSGIIRGCEHARCARRQRPKPDAPNSAYPFHANHRAPPRDKNGRHTLGPTDRSQTHLIPPIRFRVQATTRRTSRPPRTTRGRGHARCGRRHGPEPDAPNSAYPVPCTSHHPPDRPTTVHRPDSVEVGSCWLTGIVAVWTLLAVLRCRLVSAISGMSSPDGIAGLTALFGLWLRTRSVSGRCLLLR